MMRNVNQVCGVLALIGVGCLAAFGSAGDRIASAAPGQIEPAGDTGQAISIGGCNRCAWNYKTMDFTNVAPGTDIVILPRGTSGVIRWTNFFPFSENSTSVHADCLELGATGFWIGVPRTSNGAFLDTLQTYAPSDSGIRFVDGLIVRYTGPTTLGQLRLTMEYRLD